MKMTEDFLTVHETDYGSGKDSNYHPPLYFSALDDAFRNYFSTIRNEKDTLHFTVNTINHDSKIPSPKHAVGAILSFHRFFELLLKDILFRIHPILISNQNFKLDEIFDFAKSGSNQNTAGFNDIFQRFQRASVEFKDDSEVFDNHIRPWDFLHSKEAQRGLVALNKWRNKLVHRGNSIPALFSFEYLIAILIVPLVKKILDAQIFNHSGYKPFFQTTQQGLKLLDQICSIQISFSELKNTNDDLKFRDEIMRLFHLKEIGRASMQNELIINLNIDYYDSCYKNPIKRAERFANAERKLKHFNSVQKCLCCGLNSMVVYEMPSPVVASWYPYHNICWLRCYNCDYSIRHDIGDPFDYGLVDEPIFPPAQHKDWALVPNKKRRDSRS